MSCLIHNNTPSLRTHVKQSSDPNHKASGLPRFAEPAQRVLWVRSDEVLSLRGAYATRQSSDFTHKPNNLSDGLTCAV